MAFKLSVAHLAEHTARMTALRHEANVFALALDNYYEAVNDYNDFRAKFCDYVEECVAQWREDVEDKSDAGYESDAAAAEFIAAWEEIAEALSDMDFPCDSEFGGPANGPPLPQGQSGSWRARQNA